MKITQPSRLTFWRFIFGVSAILPLLSVWQAANAGLDLGVDIFTRPSWIGLLAGLSLVGLLPLLALTLTWSRHNERVLTLAESPERVPDSLRWLGWLFLIIGTIGFTATWFFPFLGKLFGGEGWIRFLVFWYFSLIGMFSIKLIRRDTSWFMSLLAAMLIQTTFHLVMLNLSRVTDYPFSMGWSETSRYYHPSMFVSPLVYGQRHPYPIINPALHMLLAPPYLFGFSLWGQRLWQVFLRVTLIALTAFVFARRLSPEDKVTHPFLGLYLLLYLFFGPIYFHLTIAVILVLAGYSSENQRRTWIALLLASAWSGWCRVNWYPVPALLMAVMYVLETPLKGRNLIKYLTKPALWGIIGFGTAFLFQRIYIWGSGVENGAYFYTTFVSDLFWYRLLPNTTFPIGILPALLRFSLPFWLVIYLVLRARPGAFHPVRILLSLAALTVLMAVGIIVTVKIGGGSDLHNMDSYFVMMMLIMGYLVFARYRREDGSFDPPYSLHWALVLLLFIMPLQNQLKFSARIVTYDKVRTQDVLTTLQDRVDQVNSQGGEILFISQRHLISLGMLKNVTLVPEYEREDLMEMAMGNNTDYLERFQSDMDNQRFDLIIVDQLRYAYLGIDRSFSEENNVWVGRIMKPILCNYELEKVFPDDEIAFYVPQTGERQCP